ncbi:hypothetical protein CYMTET_9052 [Cymbomonas tetramitiformis]|uniref:LTD domain-containing protein n=2 Tax=Cymbomonas tetramitiformis TaxID=36881 RepID=A0AAE0GRZ4_9CHLO|nr:hypothetical protein CYMTET_9052 [Cymbomonas tetramitiformis]
MFRWYTDVVNSSKQKTSGKFVFCRDPPFDKPDEPQYHGTVIFNDAESSSTASLHNGSIRRSGHDEKAIPALPVLHWFVEDPEAARWDEGTSASLFFNGAFYDNVHVRRRGSGRDKNTTTYQPKDWPKRKFKFDFKGHVFVYAEGQLPVEEFNLQSHYDEPGQQTYMRENIALTFMRSAGVPVALAFHVHVRQNSEFYGLFSFVEQIDRDFLQRNGLSPKGPLFKAVDWTYSNLREPDASLPCPWAAPDWPYAWQARSMGWPYCPEVYRHAIGKSKSHRYLWELAKGIHSEHSDAYIFAHVDVPQVINLFASQALLLLQDRCTKNYYLYRDPAAAQWLLFPTDLEDVFPTDYREGTGMCEETDCAANSTKYCVLTCPKFNSPFFCDRNHPQDIFEASAGMNPRATYNHLFDAMMDMPSTRAMYLRRLRTLMDTYLATDYFETRIASLQAAITPDAVQDDLRWHRGNISKGVQQLIQQPLAMRRVQLYRTYGPDSTAALIPRAQRADVLLTIADIRTDPDYAPADNRMSLVKIRNNIGAAVDISGWELQGDIRFKFAPGTVVAKYSSTAKLKRIQRDAWYEYKEFHKDPDSLDDPLFCKGGREYHKEFKDIVNYDNDEDFDEGANDPLCKCFD